MRGDGVDRGARWCVAGGVRVRAWVCVVLLASCPARQGVQGPEAGAAELPVAATEPVAGATWREFSLVLSEGQAAAPVVAEVRAAQVEALGEREVAALLARLPTMAAAGDAEASALRSASEPPPRAGATVLATFPPARVVAAAAVKGASAAKTKAGAGARKAAAVAEPLRVEKIRDPAATGELALLFSQAVAGRDGAPPVTLTPTVAGRWVWEKPTLLVFKADGGLPRATEYSVTVDPRVRSTAGTSLAAGTGPLTFVLPGPRVVESAPNSYQRATRRTDIALRFDQRVDAAAVLPYVRVALKSGAAVPVELVARTEAERRAPWWVKEAGWDETVVVRPRRALPADAEVVVTVGAGAPSLEGPLRATKASTSWFATEGPLAGVEVECRYYTGCGPGKPLYVQFNNRLDAAAFDPRWVTVRPAIPGMAVQVDANELKITGQTTARTTYTLRVDGALRDLGGQTLGAAFERAFTVGAKAEEFAAPDEALTVLDPGTGGKLSVRHRGYSGLAVEVYAVTADDWEAYVAARSDYTDAPVWPGRRVVRTTVAIAGDPDAEGVTLVDLAPAIKDGVGQAIVRVAPMSGSVEREPAVTWVSATRIGLDVYADGEKLVAFTSRLADGAPIAGAQVRLGAARATSGRDGLATLKLPRAPERVVQARVGDDVAFVRHSPVHVLDYELDGWGASPWGTEALRWHVFTDRGVYRPGEAVHVKGWVRRRGEGLRGPGLPGKAVREIRYTLFDPQDRRVLGGTVRPSALGGFDMKLEIPEVERLGWVRLELEVTKGTARGEKQEERIDLGELRRPEYEVAIRKGSAVEFVGGHADLTATARYYGGGPLVGAEVAWKVTTRPSRFTPPGREDYSFGRWQPWWRGVREREDRDTRRYAYTGTVDGKGEHHLRVDFAGETTRPMLVRAEAVVDDTSGQGWLADATMLVHPAEVYVGLRTRPYARAGEVVEVEAVVVDLDGVAVAGREIVVRAEHAEKQGPEVPACRRTAASTAVRCAFTGLAEGSYLLTATTTDGQGRESRSEDWVDVGGAMRAPQALEVQEVAVVPDRRRYAGGETAELRVEAPFVPAEGVLTVRRGELVEARQVRLTRASETIALAIDDDHAPEITVQLDLVGAVPRFRRDGTPDPDLPPRPARGTGSARFEVTPRGRMLDLSVKPGASALAPGEATTVEVTVRDAGGRPVVGGEVAVVVVDEAALALTDHGFADPIESFYRRSGDIVRAWYGRDDLEVADIEAVAAAREEGIAYKRMAKLSAGMTTPERTPNRSSERITVRRDYTPLALFAAALPTDADGRAQVQVRLPDNLTRYRVTAIAAAGADKFGAAEAAITARLPLQVRPAAPRFVREGDRFELPVVVHNGTDAPRTVEVAARASGVDLVEGAGRKLTVPANERVEVRLPVTARRAGTARVEVVAAAGTLTDAASGEWSVHAPPATETAVVRGQLDDGAVVVPVAPPREASARTGGLSLATSASALTELTDAALYLIRYPYECNEQVASRMLTMMALRAALAELAAPEVPTERALAGFLKADIERLEGMQDGDGAWGWWRRGEEPEPLLTVHVAHALAQAHARGLAVDDIVMERAKWALADVGKLTGGYAPVDARAIAAYALAVRGQLGDVDGERARALYAEAPLTMHSLETLGWLLPVLGDGPERAAILQHLRGAARASGDTVQFAASDEGDPRMLPAPLRTDAVILEALLAVDPQSTLIPGLVRGLLARRTSGRWSNTQDNVFAVMALERYFKVAEKVAPAFVARGWYGDRSLVEHAVKERSARQEVRVPMQTLLAEGPKELVLAKSGPGRLYWRLAMQHAPERPTAEDRGFAVSRSYAGIDDPKDVRRDKDGTWRIRAGARVRVQVKLTTSAWRYHVALVDPLPAGLEAVDSRVVIAEQAGERSKRELWVDHENLRDDRVEVFASELPADDYEYAYTARATTRGRFVAPGVRAEEMYTPAVFGRGDEARVVVE